MPGAVLTSRRKFWPRSSRMRSTRPHPEQPRCLERGERESLYFLLSAALQPRTEILRVLRDVLGVIVVVLTLRHDLDRRQRLRVEDRDGVLTTLDQLLRSAAPRIASGKLDGPRQVAGVEYAAHADARSLERGFHDQRQSD